jgi:hypothetical protein
VPLERLTPLVKNYDLGSHRLWQDELAEIVRLIRQLPNVHVYIESDNNKLTDVSEDLPQLGQRVNYFTVTATRTGAGDEPSKEVIGVKLARDRCLIEATEPDLTTTGLIESIKSLVKDCQRLPSRLLPLFRVSADTRATASGTNAPGALILLAFLFALLIAFGVGTIQHLVHAQGKPWVAWPASISVALPCAVLFAALVFGWARSKTVLITATREDAPTFWQRKRADIAINVIVGIVLYLLGLLTAHL